MNLANSLGFVMESVIVIWMWISAFMLVAGFAYIVTTIVLCLFSMVLRTLDNYLQDRYWAKRGYAKYVGEDGQTWYVSGLD